MHSNLKKWNNKQQNQQNNVMHIGMFMSYYYLMLHPMLHSWSTSILSSNLFVVNVSIICISIIYQYQYTVSMTWDHYFHLNIKKSRSTSQSHHVAYTSPFSTSPPCHHFVYTLHTAYHYFIACTLAFVRSCDTVNMLLCCVVLCCAIMCCVFGMHTHPSLLILSCIWCCLVISYN